MPDYCPKSKYYEISTDDEGEEYIDYDSEVNSAQLDPAIQNWGVDIEITWNKLVEQSDGKIDEEQVLDIDSTSDLLCSPGKYTSDDYKLDNIYRSFGNTWSGFSDLPREFVGITLNGSFLA